MDGSESEGLIWRVTVIAAALSCLIGCALRDDTPAASKAIARFHEELNAADFGSIYDASSADLKRTISKPDFEQGFSRVRNRFGHFHDGHIEKLTHRFSTSGQFMDVDYASTYQSGSAEEHFEFRYDEGQPKLAIYRVDSAASPN